MSSVDDRIVNMQFNNKQFTQGVTESQKSLQGLEQSLQNTAKSKGLDGLASSVEGVKSRFSSMQIAGVAAVATIATKATTAGLNLVKSFTLDPIKAGFQEYQTNLNSVQTIMANTGKGIGAVNKTLDQLNAYSDKTIYNFSEMAKNIGTFTAAGVGLKQSTSAIQGIANLAALSGSNSQQASTAMYQLSQAIAAGRVNLQDWNSVVNAGMGGKQFQTALAQTAVAMGDLSKGSVQLGKDLKVSQIQGQSFRNSISAKPGEKAWLTSDVLVNTLATLDGRFSMASLSAERLKDGTLKYKTEAEKVAQIEKARNDLAKKGVKYSDEQFKALTKMADAAFNSATQVKSLPQLMGVVQESLGSIWSNAFRGMFGTFTESVNLWTKVGNIVQKGTNTLNNAVSGMITTWVDSGRRLIFLDALGNVFKSLGSIMGAMKGAFSEVFPSHAGQTMIILTDKFKAFSDMLIPSKKTLEDLRNIFGGVFAVLHIGITIVKAIATGFGAFFGEIFKGSGEASGGVLDFVGHIGELLMKLDKFLTSGGKITDLFKNIGQSGGKLAGQGIQMATNVIQGLVQGLGGQGLAMIKAAAEKVANYIPDTIKSVLGIHSPATELVPVGTNIVAGIAQGILGALQMIGQTIGKVTGAIVSFISDGIGSMDALDWATLMNTLFTGTLLLSMRSFFKSFGGIGKSISGTFGQLTDTLKTMEQQVKAKMLMSIAIAVGILTASLIALSLIKVEKLRTSLGALAIMMGIMVGSMKALTKIGDTGFKTSAKFTAIGAAMVMMATSMAILAGAVALLGNLDVKTLAKGIGAIAIMMALMVGAMKSLGKIDGVAKGAALAMLMLATAMDIMAVAVAGLGMLDVGALAKGLGALAIMMNIMVGGLEVLAKSGKGALQAAGAILIVAGAMTVLGAVVSTFGLLPMDTLKQGFGALAIGLGLMVGSLIVLTKLAPGALIVAQAMALLSAAMVGMAVAVGMFGNMDGGTLAKGFAAVAAGLIILGLAAAAAIPLAPGLAILSGTFLALGQALALAGLGMLAFGTGFALMAAVGTAGVAVLVVAFQAFMALLPALGVQFAAAFVAFIQTIAAASTKLREAFGKIIENILGVITDAIPQIGKIFSALISTGIAIIRKSVPQWVEMGATIIDKFIKSAAKHVPDMVDNAMKLVTGFMDAISKNIGPLADSAAKMIIAFLNGISDAINNNIADLRKAGLNMAAAIVNGMTGGLGGKALEMVKAAAQKIADALPGWMKKVLHINSPSRVTYDIGRQVGAGLALGITDSIRQAVSAAVQMANAVISAGDAAVAAAQQRFSNSQGAADAAQAKADLSKAAAAKVNAKKNPKLAKKLKAQADRDQKAADAAQAAADAASQQVSDAKDFASADLHGKGDIRDAQATDLAAQASRMLAKANAEAVRAQQLMKTNKKAGKAMLEQAQRDAAAAKTLADQAQASHAAAQSYYAQEVNARIAQLEADRKADEDAKKAQAEYDAADTQGKIDILNKRAEAAQAKADAANATAAALIDQAKALANTDAAGAMRLLDQAEQAAQDAKDAADQAQQAKDQAAQLLGQGPTDSGGTSSGPAQPSRSVLEDAASVVDRYTASLAAAQEAAASAQPVVQFVQNNTSPVALSASEIYRQSKNLLSAQQVKMGGNP